MRVNGPQTVRAEDRECLESRTRPVHPSGRRSGVPPPDERKRATLASAACALAFVCAVASAQPVLVPGKRIDFVVAGGAGGGLDLVGRAFEQAVRDTRTFDQPIVVLNMGQGGGNTATSYVQRFKSNPHVLYLNTNRLYLNKLAGTTPLGHDSVTPLSRLMTEYLVWAVRADAPFRSARDVLDKLKADPTSVSFAISSIPSNDQINIVAAGIAAGVDVKRVRIAAFSTALNSQLLGGHVDALSTPVSEILPLVKSGQVRLLSISSPERLSGELANVPTWRSMGIDVTVLHWRGLFGPPGLSPNAVTFWENTAALATKTDFWKKALQTYGWYDAYADSAAFRKAMDEEVTRSSRMLGDLRLLKAGK
jgi:putative tricarboxylic transport membrane protein